jgi:GNAT superfamily N-acetyltransferase
MRSRPRPPEQLTALFAGRWPVWIDADAVATRHLPRVREAFGDLEVALLVDDVLVAAAWGVPVVWNGTVADLPRGYSDALVRAVADLDAHSEVDTLVVCAAQVRPDRTGTGLASDVLTALCEAGRSRGLHQVIAPLRPTGKHRHPSTPIGEYTAWARPDGLSLDPWLRTHQRMGAHVLATTEVSQAFTGTVQQWRAWTGESLLVSGAHVVPDALAPLHVDLDADLATLVEPGVWVRHR